MTLIKRYIIEQGYYSIKDGWVASEKGNLYAVVKIDENNNPIGMAEAVLDISDIPKAIQKLATEVNSSALGQLEEAKQKVKEQPETNNTNNTRQPR